MGKLKDLFSDALGVKLLQAASNSSTATGTGVDVSKLGGRGLVIADINAISGTTPTCDLTIEEADDSSFTVNKATVVTFTQVTTTDAYVVKAIDLTGVRKYVRALATLAGTSPVYIIAVSLVGENAHERPVTQP